MILKQGLPWSTMGTRIHGRDLLPMEIFRSKHTWSSRGIAGVPMDSDMRDELMFAGSPKATVVQVVNVWA